MVDCTYSYERDSNIYTKQCSYNYSHMCTFYEFFLSENGMASLKKDFVGVKKRLNW